MSGARLTSSISDLVSDQNLFPSDIILRGRLPARSLVLLQAMATASGKSFALPPGLAFGVAQENLLERARTKAPTVVTLHDVQHRDLPEFFAMGWFPAILWAFGRIVRPGTLRQRLPYVVAAAFCYALVALSTRWLTRTESTAALAFYFDHRQQIDDDIARDATLADEVRRATPSRLAAKLGRGE